MSATGIKPADLIHSGNQVIFDRVQSMGPGDLSITTTKVSELGNYKPLATIRETPDLKVPMESFDVRTTLEEILTGGTRADRTVVVDTTAGSDEVTIPASALTSKDIGEGITIPGAGFAGGDLVTDIVGIVSATVVKVGKAAVAAVSDADATVSQIFYDLALSRPLNVAGHFKDGIKSENPFDAVISALMTCLYLESVTYKFGLRENASQSVSLAGDAIFYSQGSTYVQQDAGTGVAGQEITLEHTAFPYLDDPTSGTRYVLGANLVTGKRLVYGIDYTETITGAGAAKTVKVTLTDAVPTTDKVALCYQSPVTAVFPPESHDPDSQVAPAAIRGQNIRVLLGGLDVSDTLSSVQSLTVNWSQTLEKGEEFGNASSTYVDAPEAPTVNGTVEIKPRDAREFIALVRRAAGITDAERVVGANSSVPLPLAIELYSPIKNVDGTPLCLKTLYIEDARCTIPGYSGQVGQSQTVSLPFESDSGSLRIYKGRKP